MSIAEIKRQIDRTRPVTIEQVLNAILSPQYHHFYEAKYVSFCGRDLVVGKKIKRSENFSHVDWWICAGALIDDGTIRILTYDKLPSPLKWPPDAFLVSDFDLDEIEQARIFIDRENS